MTCVTDRKRLAFRSYFRSPTRLHAAYDLDVAVVGLARCLRFYVSMFYVFDLFCALLFFTFYVSTFSMVC